MNLGAIKISDFENQMEFRLPADIGNVVYVFFLILSGREIPFYIGETTKFSARMGNYWTAGFAAATDFKVGKAVQRLIDKGYQIVVAYKKHDDRKAEEQRLLAQARAANSLLLNDLPGYNYKIADPQQELEVIEKFCDRLIMK